MKNILSFSLIFLFLNVSGQVAIKQATGDYICTPGTDEHNLPADKLDVIAGRDAAILKKGKIVPCQNNVSGAVLKADPSITPDYSAKNPGNIDFTNPSALVNTGLPIGVSAGNAGVTSSGSASYSVPIRLPNGINNLTPLISIEYNSHRVDGLLGFGWDLAGLMAITRQTRTLYHDGKITSLSLTNQDVFALNGQRLFALNSAGYGANNTTYDTEVKSFISIKSLGTAGNGPQRFQVITKEGTVYDYGNTADSRYEPANGDGTIFMWRINQITDIYGNFIKYYYTSGSGESVINRIEYSGNGSQQGSSVIYFKYDEKIGNKDVSLYGYNTATNKVMFVKSSVILNSIEILENEELIRKYKPTYSTDAATTVITNSSVKNRFYLNNITEFGRNNKQLNSTKFNWNYATSSIKNNQLTKLLSRPDGWKDFSVLQFADFNGDGKTDVLDIFEGVDGTKKHYFAVDQGINHTRPNGNNYSFKSSVQGYPGIPIPYLSSYRTADVDGDNIDELFAIKKTGNSTSIIIASRNYYNSQDNIPFGNPVTNEILIPNLTELNLSVGDFDGDGKQELLVTGFNQTTPYSKIFGTTLNVDGPTSSYNKVDEKIYNRYRQTIDFNGNGKTDIILFDANGYSQIYEFDNSTATFNLISSSTLLNTATVKNFNFGDFNADGKTDVLRNFTDGTCNVFLSNGNHDFTSLDESENIFAGSIGNLDFRTSLYAATHHTIFVNDYNGDGKSDILYFEPNVAANLVDFTYLLSTGTDFTSLKKTVNWNKMSTDTILNHFILDINADGGAEFVYHLANGNVNVLSIASLNSESYVKQIVDGHGRSANFKYAVFQDSLDNDTVTYKFEASKPTYPLIKANFKGYLVNGISRSNGVGSDNLVTYQYRDGLVHLNGKGFLGFQTIVTTDLANNAKVRSKYTYNPTFYHSYLYSSATFSNDIVTDSIIYSTLFDHTGKIFWAYTSDITELKFLPPSAGASYITSNTTDLVNGEVKSIHKYTSDWSQTQDMTFVTKGTTRRMETNRVSTYYLNNGTAGTAYVRNMKYNYNSSGVLLNTQAEAGTTYEVKTEYLNRDVNGNPATVKTSTPNDSRVATRQTQVEYCYNGRYVCKSTDPEGYVVQATYDPALGLPLSKKGIDGRWSYLNYDDFGRLIEETLPDGNIISHSTGWANSSGFANALYFVKSESDQMPTFTTYYDMYDRELRVEKNGFTGTNIVTSKAYNAKGQLISETLPNYSSPDTTAKVTYAYNDPLNRITLKKYIAQSTTYVYDGFTTTVTKPDQHTLSSEYYINGKLKSSSDSKSNKVTYSYHGNGEFEKTTAFSKDISFVYTNGFKTSMTDPNTGTLNYDNDALGQLRTETDARSQARTFTYDKLGRIITEATSEGTKTYSYVSSGNGAGQISSVTMPKHTLTYTYDENSRLLSLVEVIDDQILTTSYTYDSKGRLETKTYPSGFAIKQVYNNYGYHFQTIRADGSNSVIWQLTAKNAFDQTTNYYFGNGVTTSKTYDSYNLLRNIDATNPNATEISIQEIYKYQTEFDPANGNLKFRTDAKTGRNFREDFQYDDLDRLWKITRTGEPDKVINYYDNGNISSKFDVGNYAYNATKPNAVENVGNTSPFSSKTQIIEYSTIGKATSIKEGIYKSELIYGLSNERIIMYERLKRDTTSAVYDSLKSTTYYAGDYEIVKNQAGLQTKRHYIFGPDGLIGVYIITTTGSGQLYYTNTDHLGSINVLTDQGGAVVEEYSFDSWGRRRDPNNWSNYTSPINGWSALLTRGYTFHEHLEKHGLINMNGRLYDPLTGRMLSPDNYVQEPQNTQSHNRYTYAFNNPLKFTDPSGNITWWDVLAVGEIIGGVILGFTPAYSLSPSFIASGVNHFAATASVMQDAKAQGYNISYDDASNGVGIGFSYSFTFGGGGSQQKQPPGTTNTPPPPIETSTAPVADVSPIPSGPFLANNGGISDTWNAYTSQKSGENQLLFDGKNLSILDHDCKVLYSTSATSGSGKYMNDPKSQDVAFKGPIPSGNYYFNNTEWKSQGTLRQVYNIVRGNGDWGDYNVPLVPINYSGTRDRFYLHGGYFVGSAGCIDVGGNIDDIYNMLNKQKYTILQVEYK